MRCLGESNIGAGVLTEKRRMLNEECPSRMAESVLDLRLPARVGVRWAHRVGKDGLGYDSRAADGGI